MPAPQFLTPARVSKDWYAPMETLSLAEIIKSFTNLHHSSAGHPRPVHGASPSSLTFSLSLCPSHSCSKEMIRSVFSLLKLLHQVQALNQPSLSLALSPLLLPLLLSLHNGGHSRSCGFRVKAWAGTLGLQEAWAFPGPVSNYGSKSIGMVPWGGTSFPYQARMYCILCPRGYI